MITAGIKDIKNNLSRYLSQVKAGEDVVITERGRPVARLVREGSADRSLLSALAPLIDNGVIALPARRIPREGITATELPGRSVSGMVIEDRR